VNLKILAEHDYEQIMKSNINPYEPIASDSDAQESFADSSTKNANRSSVYVVPTVIAGLVGYVIWMAADWFFEFSRPVSWFVQGVSLATCALLDSLFFPLPPERSPRWLQVIFPSLQILGLWSVAATVSYFTKPGFSSFAWTMGCFLLLYSDKVAARRNRVREEDTN
jgi:hypothetical protein